MPKGKNARIQSNKRSGVLALAPFGRLKDDCRSVKPGRDSETKAIVHRKERRAVKRAIDKQIGDDHAE